jgi:probable phosphoglycerate mutase
LTGPARAGSPLIPARLGATLVLVRHGQSTFVAEGRFQGRLDPPLSATGERQAALAAAWLGQRDGPPGLGLSSPPREIVSSPLVRAARSAALIAGAFGAGSREVGPPVVRADSSLVEISQGEWEGLTHDEVAARWGERLAAWRRTPTRAWAPGGERLRDADRRVRGALPALLGPLDVLVDPAREAGQLRPAAGVEAGAAVRWSIVVAHDGVLRILLLALLGLPLARFWAFPFALGGATVADLADGRASLRAHNLTAHLAETPNAGPGGRALPDRGGAL